jgi:nitrite reductase/ring-hydroxylating ferredoxin subunit
VSDAVLCRLGDLDASGAKEFSVGEGDWPLRGFVVRRAEHVAAYVNRCPHAGHPLNLSPDQFLTPDGALLLCNSHGALFTPESGVCVSGPCRGRGLQALPVRVEGDCVLLDGDADELARRFA